VTSLAELEAARAISTVVRQFQVPPAPAA